MFSRCGIYLDRVIVGLIIDGALYLKADHQGIIKYKKEGSKPFRYERKIKDKKNKIIMMSYMSVPIDILEDRDAIKKRVYESYKISLNSKNTNKKITLNI